MYVCVSVCVCVVSDSLYRTVSDKWSKYIHMHSKYINIYLHDIC